MMIRKYIFPLVLTTIALFFASVGCTRESLGDGGAHVGKNSLLLQLQVSPTDLRATEVGEDAYNENTVSSITVLFYKGGQLFWQSKESGQGGITPNGSITTPGRHYIIPVPDDKKAQLNGVNGFNVYVVCNKASFVITTENIPKRLYSKRTTIQNSEYFTRLLFTSLNSIYSVANVLNILYTKTSKIANFSITFSMLVLFIPYEYMSHG